MTNSAAWGFATASVSRAPSNASKNSGRSGDGNVDFVEIHSDTVAAVLKPSFAASRLDENPPHRLGSRRKKMTAAVPLLRRLDANQTQVCLMHQSRGLKRLTGFLLGQFAGGKLSKLLVDQRQELLGGTRHRQIRSETRFA